MDNLWSNKRRYVASDGQEYINMCIPSLPIKNLTSNMFVPLSQDHTCRIDKFVWGMVSKSLDDGIDHTLYINHIFNPFSIQEGDMMYIPIVTGNGYVSKNEPTLPDGSLLSDKMSGTKKMTYAENIEYIATMGLGTW